MGRLASVLFSEPDLELLELLAQLRPLAARKLMLLRLIDMIDAQQRAATMESLPLDVRRQSRGCLVILRHGERQ